MSLLLSDAHEIGTSVPSKPPKPIIVRGVTYMRLQLIGRGGSSKVRLTPTRNNTLATNRNWTHSGMAAARNVCGEFVRVVFHEAHGPYLHTRRGCLTPTVSLFFVSSVSPSLSPSLLHFFFYVSLSRTKTSRPTATTNRRRETSAWTWNGL